METFLVLLVLCLLSCTVCGIIHTYMCNRIPKDFKDFLCMACLPWVLLKLNNDKESLQ